METCRKCNFFFDILEDAGDYKAGKGDCVTEHKDEKGKFWLSKPVFETTEICSSFRPSQRIRQ